MLIICFYEFSLCSLQSRRGASLRTQGAHTALGCGQDAYELADGLVAPNRGAQRQGPRGATVRERRPTVWQHWTSRPLGQPAECRTGGRHVGQSSRVARRSGSRHARRVQ